MATTWRKQYALRRQSESLPADENGQLLNVAPFMTSQVNTPPPAFEEGRLTIIVKTLAGKRAVLDVHPTDSMHDVKMQIYSLTGTPGVSLWVRIVLFPRHHPWTVLYYPQVFPLTNKD